MNKPYSQTGMTLAELLITLGVAAILVVGSTTALPRFIQEGRMVTEVNHFTTALALARSMAIMQDHRVVLCPSRDRSSCGNKRFTRTFQWLESWPALTVLGVAVVTEILADKFPVVDNFLDAAQTFVKPVAGTILAASVLSELSPLQARVHTGIERSAVADHLAPRSSTHLSRYLAAWNRRRKDSGSVCPLSRHSERN